MSPPHAMWTFHVGVRLPGWLAVRSPVSLRAGTFGACLRERGSTGTGNRHACKILSLVAHMAGTAVHYGGDERKLYPSVLSQAKKHTPDTDINTSTRKEQVHISTSQNLLSVSLSLLSHTHIFTDVGTILHLHG